MSDEAVVLMGVPFARVTEAEAVERIMGDVRVGRGGWALTPNLDILRQLATATDLGWIPDAASLVVADGMPLVWASRILGRRLPERVAGSNLIWSLSAACARQGTTIYLLGGNPGAADGAAERLTATYPGLEVVGVSCPPMGFDRVPEEVDRVVQAVADARPGLVLVGLGFPKQERLIARLRPRVPGAYCLGCGISLSYVSGEVVRAPAVLQAAGLEWVHRMAQEPSRLAKRYLVHDLPFALRLGVHVARRRRAVPRDDVPRGRVDG